MNKNWFQRHQSDFDHQLPEGHKERFIQKLKQLENKPKGFTTHYWLFKIAAVIVVLFAVGSILYLINGSSEMNTQMAQAETMKEEGTADFKEAQNYFQMKLEREEKQLSQLEYNAGSFQELEAGIEKLKEDYEELEKELNQNPGNQKIINAMITNYELRIELLKAIYRLTQKKKEKIQDYEKNNA